MFNVDMAKKGAFLGLPLVGEVRIGGLEPPLLSEPDPKSGAATNYAISAYRVVNQNDMHCTPNPNDDAKIQLFFILEKKV